MKNWVWALAWIGIGLSLASKAVAEPDPLPSWNEGKSKAAVLAFVERVTTPGSPGFVPIEERIATFDNDGTLWSEQPIYFQLSFAMDRVREMAHEHPEWQTEQPFRAVLENDRKALIQAGKQGLMKLLAATHTGMTVNEFEQAVEQWIQSARHPRFDRPYTNLIYQPMLELMDLLRAKSFRVWIVSGGGQEFMRVWAPQVYGIPREQIVGSSIKTKLEIQDGRPVLRRTPEIDFIDDKEEKPVGIQRFIGRRPIAAFGNSDGDLQMLQWTMAGDGDRFALYVRHTDEEREWAYDRKSSIGRLDRGLDEAVANGWTVVDMQRDWKVIYPFQRRDHHYLHKNEVRHAAEWSYAGPTGPEYWGDLDPSYTLAKRGRRQSPIDIRGAVNQDLPKLIFSYKPTELHLVYNGHTVQENQDAGSYAMADGSGRSFELEQFHFHSPSEHTINGHQYPLEMHLVHTGRDGAVAVIAVLFEEGEHNAALDPVWNNLPDDEDRERDLTITIDVTDLLPKSRAYYHYEGSFTTPPCTEYVKWVVLREPVMISARQLAQFRQVIDGNNRPVQLRNGRPIGASK